MTQSHLRIITSFAMLFVCLAAAAQGFNIESSYVKPFQMPQPQPQQQQSQSTTLTNTATGQTYTVPSSPDYLINSSSVNGETFYFGGATDTGGASSSSSTSTRGHVTESRYNRAADRAAKSAVEYQNNPSYWSGKKMQSDQKLLKTLGDALQH